MQFFCCEKMAYNWTFMSPWPFKCYSTIIWCMVENVGIYSAWYFIIWIYCAKRISTFTSEFLWSFYRKWWRNEHIFFCTHWITYYMSITRFLTYIFLYRIGKKIWILQCWHLSISLFVKKSNIWSVYSTR